MGNQRVVVDRQPAETEKTNARVELLHQRTRLLSFTGPSRTWTMVHAFHYLIRKTIELYLSRRLHPLDPEALISNGREIEKCNIS